MEKGVEVERDQFIILYKNHPMPVCSPAYVYMFLVLQSDHDTLIDVMHDISTFIIIVKAASLIAHHRTRHPH